MGIGTRRSVRARGIAKAAVVAAVFATVATSPALAVEGTTTLRLDGAGAKSLRDSGVKIAPVKPAKGRGVVISLPINAGLAGSTTTLLRHRGGISLESRAGKRLKLTKPRLLLGRRSLVSARIGREEIDLFKVLPGGKRDANATAGTVRLSGLGLKLTPEAGKALAQALDLERLRPKRFGTLSANASKLILGGVPGGGGGAAPGSPARQSSFCPLPSGPGPDAEPTPPPSIKPLGAADITSASLAWRVRESFIRYIASGEGTTAFDGATADPPELLPGASTALSYGYRFPGAPGGWLNSATGQATLKFSGGLHFQFSAHGIDLKAEDPEIQLNGANSRAIFDIRENGGLTAQRKVLVNLDLSRAAAITQSGNSYTYDRVPAAVPGGTASSVFAGFYAPGAEFGCFSVSFTAG